MGIITMTIGAIGVKRTMGFILFFLFSSLASHQLGYHQGHRRAFDSVSQQWEARAAEQLERAQREMRRQYEQARESEERVRERVVYKDRVVERFKEIVVNSPPSPDFCDMPDDRVQAIHSIAEQSGATTVQ